MNAQKVSSTVAVPLSTMIEVTFRLSVSDVPRSSVKTSPRYSTYCWRIGLSKPAACSRLASSSCDSRPPSADWIGLPGATRISRKTIVSRMKTVGIASAKRVSA